MTYVYIDGIRIKYFEYFDRDWLAGKEFPKIGDNEMFALRRTVGHHQRIEVYKGSMQNKIAEFYSIQWFKLFISNLV
jgi:hypothetical protein